MLHLIWTNSVQKLQSVPGVTHNLHLQDFLCNEVANSHKICPKATYTIVFQKAHKCCSEIVQVVSKEN